MNDNDGIFINQRLSLYCCLRFTFLLNFKFWVAQSDSNYGDLNHLVFATLSEVTSGLHFSVQLNSAFESSALMSKYNSRQRAYMVRCIMNWSIVVPKDFNAAVTILKTKWTIKFVNLCSTSFRVLSTTHCRSMLWSFQDYENMLHNI